MVLCSTLTAALSQATLPNSCREHRGYVGRSKCCQGKQIAVHRQNCKSTHIGIDVTWSEHTIPRVGRHHANPLWFMSIAGACGRAQQRCIQQWQCPPFRISHSSKQPIYVRIIRRIRWHPHAAAEARPGSVSAGEWRCWCPVEHQKAHRMPPMHLPSSPSSHLPMRIKMPQGAVLMVDQAGS